MYWFLLHEIDSIGIFESIRIIRIGDAIQLLPTQEQNKRRIK